MSYAGKIGKAIVEHFVDLFNPGDSFILCVHQKLLDSIYLKLKFDKEVCEKNILSKFRNGILNDVYVCVAIAGFQVSLAYENQVFSIASYNNVLTEKLCVNDNLQKIYSDHQVRIWEDAQQVFCKKNLHLIIPKRRMNSNRYVQYPNSQRVVENAILLKYKELFSRIHLEPNSAVTFDQFSACVFDTRPNYSIYNYFDEDYPTILPKIYENIARKTIFEYYLAWDGESHQKEITEKKEKNVVSASSETVKEDITFLKVFSDQTFQCFDTDKKPLSISTLYKEKKAFYTYDSLYSDWTEVPKITSSELFGKIVETSFFEFLAGRNNLKQYVLEEYKNGIYSFLVFAEDMPENLYEILGCTIRIQGALKFRGGLKNAAGEWLLGILPTLIAEEKYKEVYVDSEKTPIINGCLDLNTLSLSLGEHSVKAKETGILYFSVVEPCTNKQLMNSGWTYDWRAAPLVSASIHDSVLYGLKFNPKLFPEKFISKKLEGPIQSCIARNKALHRKPFTNGIRLHVEKRRGSI